MRHLHGFFGPLLAGLNWCCILLGPLASCGVVPFAATDWRPEELFYLNVECQARIRLRHELQYLLQELSNADRDCPLTQAQVGQEDHAEAVDVQVVDLRRELHQGRLEGIPV